VEASQMTVFFNPTHFIPNCQFEKIFLAYCDIEIS
jgi:hypothetical protein